jgi:tetratricopeptide (TPR) repeat protein
LEALAHCDPDGPTNRDWAPLWLGTSEAYYLTGKYQEALETARQGQERFPGNIRLRRREISALIALGRMDEIDPLFDALERMEPEGSRSPGGEFRGLAAELARLGYGEESRVLAERALDWYRARDPDGYQEPRARALLLVDRPEEALALLAPLVEESPDDLSLRGLHGIALALNEDRDGAQAEAEWLEELDRPYLRGENTYWRAAILAHLGRDAEAARLLATSLTEGRPFSGRWADPNFMPLWGYQPFEEVIAPKG